MPSNLTAACAALDLTPGEGVGDAPDWVHLLPIGDFRGQDGRAFKLSDPDAVIAASMRGLDLVIDYEHQTEAQAELKSGPIPAAGWIKALQARADGLWGKVEWTALARSLIGAKAYRYLSPVIRYSPQDRQVRRLTGAGLVHNPNLELTALSREEPTVPDAPEKTPTADATDQRLLALMERMETFLAKSEVAEPDPADYAPVAVMRDLLAERNTALASMSERAAEKRVGEALAAGFITPAMRPWATALCREKPQSFEDFIAAGAPAYAHILRPVAARLSPHAAAAPQPSPEARAICRMLDLDPKALLDPSEVIR
ncbi:phage protease [Amaricoccus sp.]|uniref:phage protease n=1 Tax=Amaricoccus sp. TaxID=1872485 RepID=UPI001B65889B|nr:phage protease [Amaricoccus sp.]MBP7003757.1 hypothetical protein [Amaricoccus sp.]